MIEVMIQVLAHGTRKTRFILHGIMAFIVSFYMLIRKWNGGICDHVLISTMSFINIKTGHIPEFYCGSAVIITECILRYARKLSEFKISIDLIIEIKI